MKRTDYKCDCINESLVYGLVLSLSIVVSLSLSAVGMSNAM